MFGGRSFFVPCPASAQEAPINEFVYDAHGKRDPLQPLVNSGGVIINYATDLLLTDLTLEGILMDFQGDNAAIINGRIVKAKDVIGAFVVVEVKTDMVILSKDNKQYEIRLKRGGK